MLLLCWGRSSFIEFMFNGWFTANESVQSFSLIRSFTLHFSVDNDGLEFEIFNEPVWFEFSIGTDFRIGIKRSLSCSWIFPLRIEWQLGIILFVLLFWVFVNMLKLCCCCDAVVLRGVGLHEHDTTTKYRVRPYRALSSFTAYEINFIFSFNFKIRLKQLLIKVSLNCLIWVSNLPFSKFLHFAINETLNADACECVRLPWLRLKLLYTVL